MIGIVGPGAIGTMLAHWLTRDLQSPLQIIGRKGAQALDAEVVEHGQLQRIDIARREGTCTLLLVVVKSYDLETALRSALPSLQAGGAVVLLSNGYLEPQIAPLRREFPHFAWRKGIVTRGVRRDEKGSYHISNTGRVIWGGEGSPTAAESEVLEALRDDDVTWSATSCALRQEKWFYNTALNTLCAAYRLPSNGAALRLFAQDLERVAREVFRLGRELWPDWNANWEALWLSLQQLIQSTEDNENSMARDVRLGRRTEAAVLSGCLNLASQPKRYPLLMALHQRLQE